MNAPLFLNPNPSILRFNLIMEGSQLHADSAFLRVPNGGRPEELAAQICSQYMSVSASA